MANYKRVQVELIPDPPTDQLGPAMLALTPMQRRFTIAWIAAAGKNAAQCARAAGYSSTNNCERIDAHHLTRNPKVLRAMQEEAGRTLNGMAAIAVAKLSLNLNSSSPKVRQVAIDSILDRTGFPRRTERSLDVTDTRQEQNYEQLLTMVSERLRVLTHKEPLKAIEAPYTEVENVERADGSARIQDERAGGAIQIDAATEMAASQPPSGTRKARKGHR